MTPIERMARAMAATRGNDEWVDEFWPHYVIDARTALLALATPEAISDEMLESMDREFEKTEWPGKASQRRALAAAIRAAAGG